MKTSSLNPPTSIVVPKKGSATPKKATKAGGLDRAKAKLRELKVTRKQKPAAKGGPKLTAAEEAAILEQAIAENQIELDKAILEENESVDKQARLALAKDEVKKIHAQEEAESMAAESPRPAKREAASLRRALADTLKAKKAKVTGKSDASSTVHSYHSNGDRRLANNQGPRRLRSDRPGGDPPSDASSDPTDESHPSPPNNHGGGGGGGGDGSGGGGASGDGGGGGGGSSGGSVGAGSEHSMQESHHPVITLRDLDPQNGNPTEFQGVLINIFHASYGDAVTFTKYICDTIQALAKFSAYEFSHALKNVQRLKEVFPTGTPLAIRRLLTPTFPATLIRNLKGLRLWAIIEDSVGERPHILDLTPSTVEKYATEAARQEDPSLAVKVPPIPKLTSLDGYKTFEENLSAYLAAHTSTIPSRAPLDYLLRPATKPTREELDDLNGPLTDYLRSCQLIVMKRGTPEYVRAGHLSDQQRVYATLRTATQGSLFAHFVTKHKDTKHGRQAFFDLKEHCQGKASQQHLIHTAKKARRTAHYDGKAGFSFQKYIDLYSTTHETFEEQGEPEYPRAQITDFLDGIKCTALATTVQLVRADPLLQLDFLGVANAIHSEILRLKLESYHSRRHVGAMTQGGGRGGGRGRGRGRGGGRGDKGRGSGRGQSKGKPHPDERKGELRMNADGTIFTGTYFWWKELGGKQEQVKAARNAKKKRSISATRSNPDDMDESQPKKAKSVAQEATVVDVDDTLPMDVVAVADDEVHPVKERTKPLAPNAGTLMGKGARKTVTP